MDRTHPTRGFSILIARVSRSSYRFHFAITLPQEKPAENQSIHVCQIESRQFTRPLFFSHGRHTRQIRPTRQVERVPSRLSSIAQRSADGVLDPQNSLFEKKFRQTCSPTRR